MALDVYSSMRGGYFVELGAYDGISSSNTLSLERHYGWRGLCIEAGTDKFKRLVGNRPLCTNRLAVVGPEDDAVVFEHAHPSEQEVSWKPVQPEITGGDQRSTTSMRTLLRSASAPSWIDFLSLDVEGGEEDVLQSWPWDEYSIGALTVEHNFEEPRRTRIRELLKHRGFHAVHHYETDAVGCMQWTERCIPRCPCVDDWFLHPAVFARYNGTVRTNNHATHNHAARRRKWRQGQSVRTSAAPADDAVQLFEPCSNGCSYDVSGAERSTVERSCLEAALLDRARHIDPSQCGMWGDGGMLSSANETLGAVPCILHYQGRDNAKSHEFVDSWRTCMPPAASCRTMFWTDELLNRLVATKYPQFWKMYSAAPVNVLRWDMSRYMVLHAYGGIYFDNDYECVAPQGKFELGSGAARCEFSLCAHRGLRCEVVQVIFK